MYMVVAFVISLFISYNGSNALTIVGFYLLVTVFLFMLQIYGVFNSSSCYIFHIKKEGDQFLFKFQKGFKIHVAYIHEMNVSLERRGNAYLKLIVTGYEASKKVSLVQGQVSEWNKALIEKTYEDLKEALP